MPAIAAIAIGSIAGGALSYAGAKSQANAALSAADANTQLQWQMYNQNRADLAPWRKAGTTAIGQLSQLTGPGGELSKDFTLADFTKDPGYDFRLAEGKKSLERSAAARGNLFSGSTLKALDRYNQNFASNEFGNAYDRFQNNRTTRYNQLAGVAGTGQMATNTTAQLGANAATNIGNTNFEGLTQAGNAQAAGYAGIGNAINSGIGNATNWYLLSQLNNKPAWPPSWSTEGYF